MRTAGGVLGIIGSIAGFIVAGLGFLFGVLGVAVSKAANEVYADPTVSAFVGTTPGASSKASIDQAKQAANDLGNWSTVISAASGVLAILCVVALIGGIMTFFKPSIGAIMMAVAGVGGFILVQVFWSFSGFMLVLGAVLAFLGSMQKPAVRQAQPAVVPGYYPAPQHQAYQPQQNYYPQQQQAYQPQQVYPQTQGFPAPAQYGQAPVQPAQQYYPQPAQQTYQPQQYYPQPQTAPQGQQVVPPQDNTKLN